VTILSALWRPQYAARLLVRLSTDTDRSALGAGSPEFLARMCW